jgi:hypothetical protein
VSRNKGEQLTITGNIIGVEHVIYDVYRNLEDNGAFVLCSDTAQGLEIPQLGKKVFFENYKKYI